MRRTAAAKPGGRRRLLYQPPAACHSRTAQCDAREDLLLRHPGGYWGSLADVLNGIGDRPRFPVFYDSLHFLPMTVKGI